MLRISLKSNGQAVADNAALISVQVRRAVNAIPTARLLLAYGDVATSDWPAAEVDTTNETHAGLTQYDSSDWDFLVARAARNGLLVSAG